MKIRSSIILFTISLTALSVLAYFIYSRQEDPDREVPPMEKPVETPAENPPEGKIEEKPAETVKDDGPKTLYSLSADSITSLILVNKNQTVRLKRINGRWVAEDESFMRFDPQKILSIIKDLSRIDSIKTVSFDSSESEQKGIHKDSRSISISDGIGEQTIYPGSYSEKEQGYYISIEGSDEIYLVKNTLGSALNIETDDLRNRKLPLPDISRITTLKIHGEPPLHILPYERFDTFAPEGFQYMMDSPYNRLVPVDTKMFLEYLMIFQDPLLIADFIDKGSPADYGIDVKTADFELTDETGKTLILHRGHSAGNAEVYAKLGTEDQIFTVKTKDLTFLKTSAFHFADKQIRPIDLNRIDTLNITTAELTVMLTIDKRNGEEIYALNGMEISKSDFSEIFKAVTELKLDGEVSYPVSTEKKELSISWKLKDGGSQWAHTDFHPYDNKSYAVSQYEDYTPLFLIEKEKINAMIQKVTGIADKAFGF